MIRADCNKCKRYSLRAQLSQTFGVRGPYDRHAKDRGIGAIGYQACARPIKTGCAKYLDADLGVACRT
jgi:hypothetical protein